MMPVSLWLGLTHLAVLDQCRGVAIRARTSVRHRTRYPVRIRKRQSPFRKGWQCPAYAACSGQQASYTWQNRHALSLEMGVAQHSAGLRSRSAMRSGCCVQLRKAKRPRPASGNPSRNWISAHRQSAPRPQKSAKRVRCQILALDDAPQPFCIADSFTSVTIIQTSVVGKSGRDVQRPRRTAPKKMFGDLVAEQRRRRLAEVDINTAAGWYCRRFARAKRTA